MAIRQTRLFVPPTLPYDSETWAETLLGRVIQPLVAIQPQLLWFRFSRYVDSRNGDVGDCIVEDVPVECEAQGRLRSLRFRFELPDAELEAFEEHSSQLIRDEKCVITDWRDFDLVRDLGSNRFIGENRGTVRRMERAHLLVKYLHSVSELVLHSSLGPDAEGRFRFEHNDESQYPPGSSFESVHHLFCNITQVPMFVQVHKKGGDTVAVKSPWCYAEHAGPEPVVEFPVRS